MLSLVLKIKNQKKPFDGAAVWVWKLPKLPYWICAQSRKWASSNEISLTAWYYLSFRNEISRTVGAHDQNLNAALMQKMWWPKMYNASDVKNKTQKVHVSLNMCNRLVARPRFLFALVSCQSRKPITRKIGWQGWVYAANVESKKRLS